HRLADVVDDGGGGGRGRRIADRVIGVRAVNQRPAVVDEDQPGLIRCVPVDHALGDQPQQVGLAACVVAEYQHVCVGAEVEEHGGQGALVDRKRDLRSG